jgi:hypothetical protein
VSSRDIKYVYANFLGRKAFPLAVMEPAKARAKTPKGFLVRGPPMKKLLLTVRQR